MAYDLSIIDRYTLQYRYVGTTIIVDVVDTLANNVVESTTFINAVPGAPIPNEITSFGSNRITALMADVSSGTGSSVTSVAGKVGAVTLTSADVSLGNVDNTSDTNKPISTATQTALNLKADTTALSAKQNTLTAGTNITIVGNTISASGGGTPTSQTITLTGSRVLASADNGATLIYSGSTNIVLTINVGLAASGFSATVLQAGTGTITMAQGSGVGFDNSGATKGVNTLFTIVQQAANQYGFQNPVPLGLVPLAISGIPFILCSGTSMSIGANGAVTGITALPTTFTSAYVYINADAIATGVPAGWYYAVFSSTSACTLYNNRYITGSPSVPSPLTPFSGTTGIGAYTQINTEVQGLNVTIPGGSMGPNGHLENVYTAIANNTPNVRVVRNHISTFTISSVSMSGSTLTNEDSRKLSNLGSLNQQMVRPTAASSNSATTPSYTTINTATDQLFEVGMTLSVSGTTDYLILAHSVVSVMYGA